MLKESSAMDLHDLYRYSFGLALIGTLLSLCSVSFAQSNTSTNGNRRIAFAIISAGSDAGIYTINSDGSGLRHVSSGFDGEPAWSPNGNQIAFSRFEFLSGIEIWVMNADGSNQKRLTDPYSAHPRCPPDETKIAYQSTFGVMIMNADGSDQILVNAPAVHYWQPSWFSDGSKLAVAQFGDCRVNSPRSEERRVGKECR